MNLRSLEKYYEMGFLIFRPGISRYRERKFRLPKNYYHAAD